MTLTAIAYLTMIGNIGGVYVVPTAKTMRTRGGYYAIFAFWMLFCAFSGMLLGKSGYIG